MISMIKGMVLYRGQSCLTVMPEHVGIGFDVHVVQPALFEIGKPVELVVYMHFNQENGPTLYGFKTVQEREFFSLVIGCSGIGPKIAFAILEQASVAEFVHAIQSLDSAWLSKLKGIGAKKAEQLIIQLKGKMNDFVCTQGVQTHGVNAHIKQLNDVLQSLSYSRIEIQQALAYVCEQSVDTTVAFEPCLRKALLFLAQR